MPDKITIAYFKCETNNGEELYHLLMNAIRALCVENHEFILSERECSQTSMLEAYLCDDIIIFDASLEASEGEHYKHYDSVFEPIKNWDHALIVSRTVIPFNLTCLRKGGYPQYITTGRAEYKEKLSNHEIVQWVLKNITDDSMHLPNKRKLDRNYFKENLNNKELADKLYEIISENQDEAFALYHKKQGAFVSYLSRYSRYFKNDSKNDVPYSVEDLIDFISESKEMKLQDIGYFPPGTLCRELMSVQRRWEIVSVTDDFIRNCRQFWILKTMDYAQSWWTRSEIVTLSYILMNSPEDCPDIYVAVPDCHNGKISFQIKQYRTAEEKLKFLPTLTSEQTSELARFFVNSRTDMNGYESQRPMKLVNKLPKFALSGIYKLTKKMVNETEAFPKELAEEFNESTFEQYYASMKSFVYTKAFWDEWILECPSCKKKFFEGWNWKDFLYLNKTRYCHVINKKELRYDPVTKDYGYICRQCGGQFRFRIGYHYRWWTMLGGRHTYSNGTSVEKRIALYFKDGTGAGDVDG